MAVFLVLRYLFVASVISSTFAFSESLASNDKSALLGFKNSVSRDPSNLLSSWDPNSDHCKWYGVTCDEFSGNVIALNFTGGMTSLLAGTLPASIGDLSELRTLIISNNEFSGEIPANIGNLRFLEILELQGNNFSGKFPDQISALGSLKLINFSFNSISGEIPSDLIGCGKLRAIDLSNNQLSGQIRINSLCESSELRHLKLSNNVLSGSIPKEIGNLKNLRTLLLDGNTLGGGVPAEIGQISELRILDVSTNSLTGEIPKELANCQKLAVVLLTNLSNFAPDGNGIWDNDRLDFNAFDGGVSYELLTLPTLQILWAPRANLHGPLPGNLSDLCSLRVVHLGQNSFNGTLPESFGMCKNLTFLDLSYNRLEGYFPKQLQVPCMMYFNVSQNNISGVLPSFSEDIFHTSIIASLEDLYFLELEDLQMAYSNIPLWGPQMGAVLQSTDGGNSVIVHDFSWNQFFGLLPLFSVADEFLKTQTKPVYRLLLNNNMFNGHLPGELVSNCNDLLSISVNLSVNQLSCEIHEVLPLNCLQIREFEAADNQIGGSLTPGIGNLKMLQHIDLRGNKLFGSLPDQLGNLMSLKAVLLGFNNLTGEIPTQLGQLVSLMVLDLSHNALTGSIPATFFNAKNLEILLLNNNKLSGEIPPNFSTLLNLTVLDVSFNNLSGHIPHLRNAVDCDWFKGNDNLEMCQKAESSQLSLSYSYGEQHNEKYKKFLVVALVISAAVIIFISLVVLWGVCWRKKISRESSLKENVLVTFADAPNELSYDNVVRATGNFSIRNLIGTGGFGSTYKAELSPANLIAVKRLSIGRIQGTQQFDAEIRTLGRIRHKNLVTLIGYYVGEGEMFLVYNYLSGGNLETFIHDRSGKNLHWSVIYKITLDVAQALAYLHYSCVPRILHRDIKPSNILLDEKLNAYLSDFGLARLLEVSQTHLTTDVAGTFGYVAPEYATTCRVSDKSDVYSFGVVLLELLSGKKSLDPSFSEYGNGFNIVAWAKMLIKEGRSSELFSQELWEAGPKEKLLRLLKIASTCTVESLAVRPSMKQILDKLKQMKP